MLINNQESVAVVLECEGYYSNSYKSELVILPKSFVDEHTSSLLEECFYFYGVDGKHSETEVTPDLIDNLPKLASIYKLWDGEQDRLWEKIYDYCKDDEEFHTLQAFHNGAFDSITSVHKVIIDDVEYEV